MYNTGMSSTWLSNREIEIIVNEMRQIIIGAIVKNCFQYAPKKFIISTEKQGYGHNILISLQHPNVRLHLTRMRLKKLKDRLPFGETVKKKILETRIRGIEQINNDRIVRFDFETDSVTSLIIELFPRSGDILLINKDDIVETSLDGKRIGGKYSHIQLKIPAGSEVTVPDGQLLNYILDDRYRKIEEEEEFIREKKSVLAYLRDKKKKLERLLLNLDKDYAKCLQWEKSNLYGELLKANLNSLKPNLPLAKVLNYYNNQEIEIPLDVKISPRENMEQYFKKAKRLKRGLAVVEQNKQRAIMKIEHTIEQLSAVEKADNLESLHTIIATQSIKVLASKTVSKKEQKKEKSPFRYFLSKNGLRIYVGRNNEENDRLTISFSKGDDFWCHADGYAGSHVLVPLPRGKKIDEQTFLDAVNLAIYYSKAKRSGVADVLYTDRRYVTKTKNQPAGRVYVSKHKIVHVKLDEKRIREIKERTEEQPE